MNLLRKILFPFSLLYGLVIAIRNFAFDKQLLPSKAFDVPIITVGNLSTGGTGKSPMIEYLANLFPKSFQLAVLSRGYGRKTNGFLLAGPQSDATEIGDEPFQFYRKFSEVMVAVDEKRVRGVEKLISLEPKLDLILLDDAYQHRYVKAGLNILLTAYDKLYTDDFLLPTGNLREGKKGAQRADIIIVSKCPEDLSQTQRNTIERKMDLKEWQSLFYSKIRYGEKLRSTDGDLSLNELENSHVLLVTGIADSSPLEEYLKENRIYFNHIKFKDHQFIGTSELEEIERALDNLPGEKIIITTEKDYVRSFMTSSLPIYFLPIKTEIIENSDRFNDIIKAYVRKNKRDR